MSLFYLLQKLHSDWVPLCVSHSRALVAKTEVHYNHMKTDLIIFNLVDKKKEFFNMLLCNRELIKILTCDKVLQWHFDYKFYCAVIFCMKQKSQT